MDPVGEERSSWKPRSGLNSRGMEEPLLPDFDDEPQEFILFSIFHFRSLSLEPATRGSIFCCGFFALLRICRNYISAHLEFSLIPHRILDSMWLTIIPWVMIRRKESGIRKVTLRKCVRKNRVQMAAILGSTGIYEYLWLFPLSLTRRGWATI